MAMAIFDDPFDPATTRSEGCTCGRHQDQATHDRAVSCREGTGSGSEDRLLAGAVDQAVMRALFPRDLDRRRFLAAVGRGTAVAAIEALFPMGLAREVFAQGTGSVEKKDLKVGFIPVTCATPIIMAPAMGFYANRAPEVEVVKTAGWAVIRDKALAKEYDAAHMLSPMPLAISMGVGAGAQPWTIPAIENINGQAITLAIRHKDKTDPKSWKGYKFAVPFDYSMHNYL